jgi:HSP20 family protein
VALLRRGSHPEPFEPAWFWEDWPELFRRPWMSRFGMEHALRVEQFTEDGTLVIRAEMPGIDPDKDVEISLSNNMLTIHAERREEEKVEKRNYVRSEMRYGSFSRVIAVPAQLTETDIKASYKDGILEIRFPWKEEKSAVKIPIVKVE